MPEEPAKLDETVDAKPYVPPRPGRGLTGFYVALAIVVALGLFGGWFWKTWNVWWFDAGEARRRQAEAAAKLGVPVEKSVDLGGGVKLELALVPAGRFKMGSAYDQPLHWVSITRPFYLGRQEVTQEQWLKVMGTNPSNSTGTNNPVEEVSWNDCQEFLKKLALLAPGRFRLPTEAEWEWACRAGTRTRLCCGDADGALADYAWFDANSGEKVQPVGTRKPNAWDLFDMHGNVWEWCGDWFDESYYAKSLSLDPTGPPTGARRVVRGGSVDRAAWYAGPDGCCSSVRTGYAPGIRNSVVGFRVVLAPALP